MWAVLALNAVEHAVNRWIDLDAATRQGLNQLTGQLLRIQTQSPRLSVDVSFDDNRLRLAPTPLGMDEQRAKPSIFEQRPFDHIPASQYIQSATTTLKVATVADLLLLLSQSDLNGNLPVQGDLHLLQQLQRIIKQAEPDIGQALAPWIGDSLAGQIHQTLKKGEHYLKQQQVSTQAHIQDWLTEESGLIAPRWSAEQLIEGIRALRIELERQTMRVQHLEHAAQATT